MVVSTVGWLQSQLAVSLNVSPSQQTTLCHPPRHHTTPHQMHPFNFALLSLGNHKPHKPALLFYRPPSLWYLFIATEIGPRLVCYIQRNWVLTVQFSEHLQCPESCNQPHNQHIWQPSLTAQKSLSTSSSLPLPPRNLCSDARMCPVDSSWMGFWAPTGFQLA